MPPRYFTPEDANAALDEVRPLAEKLVAHRRRLERAAQERAEIAARVAGNGGGLDVARVAGLDTRIERARAGIARCVNGIHALGAIVKDLDQGLVDFPAQHDGEEVLLCWRVGEPDVDYWHGLDEGFAGRKRLPFE
jgi:hypothetical protein